MLSISRVLGLSLLLVFLPALIAQDAKDKDGDKKEVDKKEVDKKDDKKGVDPKDEDKKDPEKKDAKPEEKKKVIKGEPKKAEPEVVYGQVLRAKLKRLDANSLKDFAVEVMVPDPKKIYDLKMWQAQQLASIAQARTFPDRQNRLAQYQLQLVQRQGNIYSFQDLEVRAADNIKVRSLAPPVEYDDRGNLKKYTQKDLIALKGNSKLPGYHAEFEILRPGQVVDIYLARPQPATKKKKLVDDEDPNMLQRPEVVLIVVVAEPLPAPR